MINGLLFRPDKKQIPVAFIPNGSGNDTCNSIGVRSIEQAILYLKKGDLLKVDLNKVYFDADSFEEIQDKYQGAWEEQFKRCRYSLINASMGFIAKCVHAAKPWKPYFGAGSYTAAAFECFFKGEQPESFRINLYNQIDGKEKLTYSEDVNSILFNIMNGRYGGGGISICPISLMNDGLFDIVYFNKVM